MHVAGSTKLSLTIPCDGQLMLGCLPDLFPADPYITCLANKHGACQSLHPHRRPRDSWGGPFLSYRL